MSWIQENRFAAGLGGITAVAAVGLIAWGVSAGKKYSQAKEDFATASSAVSSMKNGPLFPDEDNLSAKKKAVEDYDKSVKDLQALFKPFAAATPPNIEPDAFSESLAKAKETVAKAFEAAGTKDIPAEFFLGYESLTKETVKKEATGILTYQMEAIGQLLNNLAAAAPVKLINIHRPPLEEEDGKTFDPKGKTYRALPVEISFNGSEATLRTFLSSLDDSGKYYFVVRSMRVMNEKSKAPTAADGNFKTEEDSAGADGGAAGGDPFGGAGGFVLPEDEPAAGDKPVEGDKPAEGDAPAEAPAESAPAASDEKILQDVLGAEKINVFLRIDILQFLEAKTP